MAYETFYCSLRCWTRTLKIANRSSSRPKVKGHHQGMTRITWTHSLYLSLSTKHMTMELGFIPSRGIFALRSSVHTSRTISQFSQKITHSQLSKVKLDLHFMMLYASLDALRITQRIATHQLYHIRSASVKGVWKVFHFFSIHRKSSNHLTLDLWFIVIRGRLVQTKLSLSLSHAHYWAS